MDIMDNEYKFLSTEREGEGNTKDKKPNKGIRKQTNFITHPEMDTLL